MSHTMLKGAKRLTCPSCRASIHFHRQNDDIGTCPRCGEWLMERGRWNRRLERVDYALYTDFDESSNREKRANEEME